MSIQCALCQHILEQPLEAITVVSGNASCEHCLPYLDGCSSVLHAVIAWKQEHIPGWPIRVNSDDPRQVAWPPGPEKAVNR